MAQDPQRSEDSEEADGGRPAEHPAHEDAPTGFPAGVPVRAEGAELAVGDVDLAAVRSVLVELGVQGSASLEHLSVEGTTALLAGITGLEAALDAVRARALVHLEAAVKADCLQREESPRQAAQVARSEASRALKESRAVAGRSLATCRRLVQNMPGMLTALAEGSLHPRSVHRVGTAMAPVTPEIREQVDEVLSAQLDALTDCGTGEIADHVARILHALDPEGAAERHRRALHDRHVTITRTDHGMATVRATIPGIDAARIRKGLSVAAEAARASGDRRGHQQIMADLFADALVGRGDGIDPTTLDVGIVITDRSLLAPAHADAATIEGFGPVPYDHVREEMLRAAQRGEQDTDTSLTLRRLYTDPEDGQLVAVEARSRSFPDSLRRFLTLAHQTCRAPYCDAPIRQMDHIVPWSRGGPTSLENGNGLCGGDNQKESSGESVRVVRDEQGVRRTVDWTTRFGQRAHRRGVNLDPLGTYRRGARDHASRSDTGPGTSPHPDPGPRRDGDSDTPSVTHPGTASSARPGPSAPALDPPGAPAAVPAEAPTIHHAFDALRLRLTDLPTRAPLLGPRGRGVDLHFLPSSSNGPPGPRR
ncbi:HNH endonuclease signature motif containing protein [Brachybacterium saurashtrense]|uniref:HNH endonuclease n=1 Tax=Brachybacterium saurashtrense TaxID=556288 RepID=A0A345YRT4_9MICO|nr:HNH endonuclease signature motif containing protein [Brachybacterium saurashtrense]AXK46636.1 HNH endonuclease [Brachybacterium saurashtrense]RRR20782.1 HNH endonuclease [Brachybacterium saurashtrense]